MVGNEGLEFIDLEWVANGQSKQDLFHCIVAYVRDCLRLGRRCQRSVPPYRVSA